MMTEHEQIMVSAERYALGRSTYIVKDTVSYIARHIDGMTEHCRNVLIRDIENPLLDNYGDECDRREWMKLLEKLKNVSFECQATKQPCSECKPFCTNKTVKITEEV